MNEQREQVLVGSVVTWSGRLHGHWWSGTESWK